MLFDEDFEAWKFGPVIPFVYRMYSIWGGLRIEESYDDLVQIKAEVCAVIDPVIEEKRSLLPHDLMEGIYSEGSPWAVTYNNGWGNGNKIAKSLIMKSELL